MMRIQRARHPGRIIALRHNSHVVFERQNTCRTRTEDSLIVGKDDSVHRVWYSLGDSLPPLSSSAALAQSAADVYNSYSNL